MKNILFITGILFVVLAVFAVQLGIDNDAGWGRGRYALLISGLTFLVFALINHFWGVRIGRFFKWLSQVIENHISRPKRLLIASVLAASLVFPMYFWFVQLDRQTEIQEYAYYVELAKSLQKGYLYVEEQPPAELLALSNPYDYGLRKINNVENFTWDLSLFEGKFYIYWGPVPSVILSLFSSEFLELIWDFHLVIFFACGIFIYSALLLATVWRHSLSHTPAWLLGFLLIVFGLSTPVTIMLKEARIYEAAIFGCQFFLIGGFFWGYLAFTKEKPSLWMIGMAAIHWSLAVGTRVFVLPSVLACMSLTLFFFFRKFTWKNLREAFPVLTILAVPLAIVGGGLAWYNWARFGSIFEFGLTYQLATVDYTNFKGVFSTSRFLDNLYIYLLHPLKTLPRFPFISRIEYLNSNDRMGGILYLTPYVLLLAIPVLSVATQTINQISRAKAATRTPADNWLIRALAASSMVSFILLMTYYFIAMRFLEDFMPAMLLLISIEIGRSYEAVYNKKILLWILASITILLGLPTIILNTVLATPPDGIAFMLNFLNTLSKLIGLR